MVWLFRRAGERVWAVGTAARVIRSGIFPLAMGGKARAPARSGRSVESRRRPVESRQPPGGATRQRLWKPSPNKAQRLARPVGTGVRADAWPAIFPEKRASSVDPSVQSYTCDRSPGNSAATGDSEDAARPSCSAAPTAPRSDG